MRFVLRWLARISLLIVLLALALLSPVAYTELACTGETAQDGYQPILTDPEWQRAESRTLMTYPEWHIVHAYDDYAKVIENGDPHDFGYVRAIKGFWSALCPLATQSAQMGGVTGESKMTIYTIGVSFSAELLAKAAYEETIGRLATMLRGSERAPLDDISARQAANYAKFLQQVPWYKWDFSRAIAELRTGATPTLRDRERTIALGFEYAAKAAYARAIEKAVEGIGADRLRIRSVVSGLTTAQLSEFGGIDVVETTERGIVIETERYRAFTVLLDRLARAGADLVEIAGNDTILFSAVSDSQTTPNALYSFRRQGFDDWRHLIVVPVVELANQLRNMGDLTLEHIHDY